MQNNEEREGKRQDNDPAQMCQNNFITSREVIQDLRE